jgi:hypothetical protein
MAHVMLTSFEEVSEWGFVDDPTSFWPRENFRKKIWREDAF